MAQALLNQDRKFDPKEGMVVKKTSYLDTQFPHFYVTGYRFYPLESLKLVVIFAISKCYGCGTAFAKLDAKAMKGMNFKNVLKTMAERLFARDLEPNEIVKFGAMLYIAIAMLTVPAGICSSQYMGLQFVPPVADHPLPSRRQSPLGEISRFFIPFEGILDHDEAAAEKTPPVNLPFHRSILKAAQAYDVDAALIGAIIFAESNYNPQAVSRAGAQGLMQLMPRTARWLGVEDTFDPELNIDGGVRYFRRLLDRFNGDVELALAAYNAGSRHVRNYGGVPPFKATRLYIQKVLKYTEIYRARMSGSADYS